MAADDLNTPLQAPARPRSATRLGTVLTACLVAFAGLIVVVSLLWVVLVDDPDGGEPVAVATIEEAVPDSTGSLTPSAAPGDAAPGPAGGERTELVALPQPPGAPAVPPTYTELIEPSRFGPLPKIGGGGVRPMEAYGRRADPSVAGLPRIVLVVGGAGISESGTRRAIEALPEGVTLAFAPYGFGLQRWVDEARRDGHEVLLQVPLEPAGFPAVDPGEHTLLVSQDPSALRDDLEWSLSRITGYTGVMNYMGGNFTSDPQAIGGLLASLAGRGLLYVEDGSSEASRAEEIGLRIGAPVIGADLVVDAQRDPAAIASALAELESIALARGVAVGTASAFPVSIEAIAEWAQSARARGIVLVSPSSVLR